MTDLNSIPNKPPAPVKVPPRERPHYVNNAEFSAAVVEYVSNLKQQVAKGKPEPVVPEYIARCFLKISEGLSHKSNFVRYTYREEMVMDAVENCLRAIKNYNIEAATRTGKPNAFSYFTQISWYAFIRRIQKEKKQQDIKLKYMSESGYEEYMSEQSGGGGENTAQAFVDNLKDRIDKVKTTDHKFKQYRNEHKPKRSRRSKATDSDLSDLMVDE